MDFQNFLELVSERVNWIRENPWKFALAMLALSIAAFICAVYLPVKFMGGFIICGAAFQIPMMVMIYKVIRNIYYGGGWEA
jgi:hydroxymethylglutaryl-CoA reductase